MARTLPGKSKGRMIGAVPSRVVIISSASSEVSPLTDVVTSTTLLEAIKVKIAVGDTALWRVRKRKSEEFHQSNMKMIDDELEKFAEELAARKREKHKISQESTQDGV